VYLEAVAVIDQQSAVAHGDADERLGSRRAGA
jgi:hypothetical protein